jgi:hypothetical protein
VSGLGARYWRTRLRRWPAPPRAEARPGYTLLIPVPGDLPVFLELALIAARQQQSTHRARTLVIPDRVTPEVHALLEAHRRDWDGPLDLVPLPPPERWFLPLLRNGSRNHGMQLYAGVAASDTTHILLHDADLFPVRRDFFEAQYERCSARGLACLGVSGVWDPWYAEHGLRLAATWDMCARTDWLRSFPPRDHLGHDGSLFGEWHTFDTTLLPQAQSDPATIDHTDEEEAFVHFNYVITSFRHFQRQGPSFYDDNFRLLFIALATQLLGASADRGFPTVAKLAGGAVHGNGPMRYPTPEEGGPDYRTFRTKLERLLACEWIGLETADAVREEVAPFDRLYDFTPDRS